MGAMSSCTKEKLYSYSALQRSALSNLSVCQRSSFTIMTGSKPEGAGEIDTGRQWSEGADLISTLDPRTFVRRDNALCIRQSSEATFSLQVAMQLDPEAVLSLTEHYVLFIAKRLQACFARGLF